jgi:HEAT repeats
MSLGRRFCSGGLGAVIGLLLSSSPSSAQPPLTVKWVDGRLSVAAHDVPLAEVLREIAHQTGVEVLGLDGIQESRSIEFADKRLAEGLKLLLEELDYVMAIRDPLARRMTPPALRVWLYLKSPPVDAPVEPGDPDVPMLADPTPDGADGTWPEVVAPASASTDQEIPDVAEASDIDPDLRLLEDSKFFDQATESSILQATNSENPAVRARALEVLGARDSSASADAFGIAMIDSDPAVSSVASALMADSNAPNVLENLGSILEHSDPVVRFTALELLTRRADPESLPYLSRVLNDENEVIRTTAQRLVKQLSLLEQESRER